MRRVALTVLLFALACSPGRDVPRDDAGRRDVVTLGRHFEQAHADLAALVPAAEWSSAVDDAAARVAGRDPNETLVELMRLAASPGATAGGDGHSGIFPLDSHERELHLLPLRLYSFPDGYYVVDALGRADLVGARVTRIEDAPVAETAALVEPLVPRDNAATLEARLPQFLVVTEVLDGLGVAEGAGRIEVELETPEGNVVERLPPVTATEYAKATGTWHPMIPPSLPAGGDALYLRRAETEWWSAYLERHDLVFVQYNQTVGDSSALGQRIVRLVERNDPRGIVLDLRHNPGGENEAAAGLLHAFRSPRLRGIPAAILVGRSTFSAAGYLSLHLRDDAAVIFVGEDTGFSKRFFGDPVPKALPESGLIVNAGGVLWAETPNGSFDRPLEPDVGVTLTAADYFGGRDPVLAAASRALHRD